MLVFTISVVDWNVLVSPSADTSSLLSPRASFDGICVVVARWVIVLGVAFSYEIDIDVRTSSFESCTSISSSVPVMVANLVASIVSFSTVPVQVLLPSLVLGASY
jgi:hypothetical protein